MGGNGTEKKHGKILWVCIANYIILSMTLDLSKKLDKVNVRGCGIRWMSINGCVKAK